VGNPVGLVTVHHEGAGTPSDVPRGAAGGYTYWIGASRYERLRDVWSSFATLGFNHISLDVCLSGNRMTSPVTAADLELIRMAVADARNLGYVIGSPVVLAHRNSPGSSTVCPGDRTMARWSEVVAACTRTGPTPAPAPKVKPMYDPPLGPIAAVWQDEHGKVLAAVNPNGDVYAWAVPYRPWPSKATDFAGRRAARIGQAPGLPAGRYVITDTAGETYAP
jgi:hypothetical protein